MNFSLCIMALLCLHEVAAFTSSYGRIISRSSNRLLAQTTASPPVDNGVKEYSFVQDDLRTYAMKLHSKDQAPKEGKEPAKVPFTKWAYTRADYLQFLVDSLVVYEAFDTAVATHAILSPLKDTGLERVVALKEDIAWMVTNDPTLTIPASGPNGHAYRDLIKKLADESIPKFICHYYNHYFAHTAGGRMIGKTVADKILDGFLLKFYQWEGDVKPLLENTRHKIDGLAKAWTDAEKQACLEETMACFRYGGALMTSMQKY